MKIQVIDIDKIIPDVDQPRKTFEEIGDLVKSITKEGLIEPLKVKKKGSDEYLLIDGERRFRAITKIYNVSKDESFRKINCIVIRPRNKSIIQLISDVQKHKLPHLEEGEAYKKLLEKDGLDIKDISIMIGKPTSYIRNKLKLTAFNEETKQLIRDKKLPAQLLYGIDITKFKSSEDEIVSRVKIEKPDHAGVRRIVLEEIERHGALINHFIIDMDKFIKQIKGFTRRSNKLNKIDIEKKIGLKVSDVISESKFLVNSFNDVEKLRDKNKDVIYELESIMKRYGKGTVITKELIEVNKG